MLNRRQAFRRCKVRRRHASYGTALAPTPTSSPPKITATDAIKRCGSQDSYTSTCCSNSSCSDRSSGSTSDGPEGQSQGSSPPDSPLSGDMGMEGMGLGGIMLGSPSSTTSSSSSSPLSYSHDQARLSPPPRVPGPGPYSILSLPPSPLLRDEAERNPPPPSSLPTMQPQDTEWQQRHQTPSSSTSSSTSSSRNSSSGFSSCSSRSSNSNSSSSSSTSRGGGSRLARWWHLLGHPTFLSPLALWSSPVYYCDLPPLRRPRRSHRSPSCRAPAAWEGGTKKDVHVVVDGTKSGAGMPPPALALPPPAHFSTRSKEGAATAASTAVAAAAGAASGRLGLPSSSFVTSDRGSCSVSCAPAAAGYMDAGLDGKWLEGEEEEDGG